MDCIIISLDITSLILIAMSNNLELSLTQKALKDWVRLPERQESFPGLVRVCVFVSVCECVL